jgi:hypothetical protein
MNGNIWCAIGVRSSPDHPGLHLWIRRQARQAFANHLNWRFAAKMSELSRHAEVSSKCAGVSCPSSLHLDNGGETTAPDIHFKQISQSTVRITTATRRDPLDVGMVVFRQEQTWTG